MVSPEWGARAIREWTLFCTGEDLGDGAREKLDKAVEKFDAGESWLTSFSGQMKFRESDRTAELEPCSSIELMYGEGC
ncbi:MAG: hypothetical protein IZT59_03590 [Verrucomicrobia bacterium]|nr:hypothetical protein [Verrucomicrobiota bacterium]